MCKPEAKDPKASYRLIKVLISAVHKNREKKKDVMNHSQHEDITGAVCVWTQLYCLF